MKFHKRQLILASLVVALGAAVYLNWQFSGDNGFNTTGFLEPTKELGEAKYVNTSYVDDQGESTQANAKISDATKEYFETAKENRDKSHSEAQERIKDLSSSSEINADIKDEITKQIESLAQNIEKEVNIENLVKAKGFEDCVVSIQNGECIIVVSPGKLDENCAVVIRDIACGQSGVAYDKVKIIESK